MRGDYSVGRMLGKLHSGAEQADKTQQDLTTGGPWPRVSKIPAIG